MTASVWLPGLKVSQLTLNQLMDTGFYLNVDVTKAEDSQFGRGDGCAFAQGTSNPSP